MEQAEHLVLGEEAALEHEHEEQALLVAVHGRSKPTATDLIALQYSVAVC